MWNKILIIVGIIILLLLMFGRRTVPKQESLSGSEWYAQQLQDPRWERKRDRILERDDYECQKCGDGYNLHVHHYWYNGRPWEVPDSALVTLCEDCHEEIHGY